MGTERVRLALSESKVEKRKKRSTKSKKENQNTVAEEVRGNRPQGVGKKGGEFSGGCKVKVEWKRDIGD